MSDWEIEQCLKDARTGIALKNVAKLVIVSGHGLSRKHWSNVS